MMKILMIGGTGTISSAITRLLAESEHELWLLNRGNRQAELPAGVRQIVADVEDEQLVAEKLGDMTFDVVCEFIGFVPEQVARDIRLFKGRTRQYVYISSASAYNKPARGYIVNEGTTLANPHWEYSRVRPSHTYCERAVPLGVHGLKGSWQVVKRMMEGKQVLIQGDGSSLWTMTWNEDFARGFIGLLGNPHAIGEAFQIMNDETLTWTQIYQTIADVLHVELKPYYVASSFLADVCPKAYDLEGGLLGDKAVSVVFDCSKLKRAVPGFQARVRFEEGVRRTIDYILKHPELQEEDPEFDGWCDRVIAAQEKAKIGL